ncbi:FHA domain-containing protein [Vulgatibacter sp.]|uniref:FHA domain-containing protein n=1 Tax=Vulgatibacter sp. TaxID=1971226 RepID=UPI0035628E47
MGSLLAQLGTVCEACSTWCAPGVLSCTGCGGVPRAAALLHGHPTPPPAQRPPTPPAPGPGCGSCGRSHPAGLLFCPACGARLGGAAQSTSVPPRQLRLHPGGVRLVLLRGLGPTGSPWPLADEVTPLGRERFPADDTVPAQAATLLLREGRLFVRDGGAGCVFVRIRHPEVLRPGALFAVGDQLLRFSCRLDGPARGAAGIPVFGSPLPAATQLRIERIHLGGVDGAAWIRPAPVQLGRVGGQIHFPDDPFVSSRHCEVDADPEGATLRDLGSANGTFVQVPAGAERELSVGDTLRVGRNILRVEGRA